MGIFKSHVEVEHGLVVDLVGLGLGSDSMIWRIFSNLDDSMILWLTTDFFQDLENNLI